MPYGLAPLTRLAGRRLAAGPAGGTDANAMSATAEMSTVGGQDRHLQRKDVLALQVEVMRCRADEVTCITHSSNLHQRGYAAPP
jgi:hypothetical protein